MNIFDYIIVAGYLIALLAMGFFLKSQSTEQDYFLGGRTLGWKPLSLSIMATQLSAVSFISAPAFVGMREGGGLVWLSYELALPLAMLFLLATLYPYLHRLGVISIYDYLETRFDTSSRVLISFVFQISRSFATGIMVYAVSIILQSTMGLEPWQSIVIIGVITLIYSLQGGMKAVVYGDAAQMILIILGTVICLYMGLSALGGWNEFVTHIDKTRLSTFNLESTGFDGQGFGLLPMIFGGLVLYAAYYGCDQSEAQRALSAKNTTDLNKMVLTASLLRFPITLLYCLTGLVIGTLVLVTPALQTQIPQEHSDWMLPIFIVEYLPHGLIGLLVVAILAAAMSSVSSAINSLAAVSVNDIKRIIDKPLTNTQPLLLSRITSGFWGIITLLLSFFAGDIAPTIIEAINKIGSVFYGPILATFTLGVLTKRVNAPSINIGILCGVATNIVLWLFVQKVFWFWWNAIGFGVTAAIALGLSYSLFVSQSDKNTIGIGIGINDVTNFAKMRKPENLTVYLLLITWFFVIFTICWFINYQFA